MILLSTTQTKENEMANLTALKTQVSASIEALISGDVRYSDRVFINHVLEEFERLIDAVETGGPILNLAEMAEEMVGSTAELIEDGLDD
jgi:hypothetical protein